MCTTYQEQAEGLPAVSSKLRYCMAVLVICAFRFQYKRYPLHVVLGYLLGKCFPTKHIAATSGRAVVNDIPPQYKHSSLYAAARVKDKNDTLRKLALRVYFRRGKLVLNVLRFKHSSRGRETAVLTTYGSTAEQFSPDLRYYYKRS